MALLTIFNRLKKEIGVKKCLIIDGNVGDVYLNEKNQTLDLKDYLTEIFNQMNFDDILYWDKENGLQGDSSHLEIDDDWDNEDEEDDYDDDEDDYEDDDEDLSKVVYMILKNLNNQKRKTAFILNLIEDNIFPDDEEECFDYDEQEALSRLYKTINDTKIENVEFKKNESIVILIAKSRSIFPAVFYQSNPEISCFTLSLPDHFEREEMLQKVEKSFNVNLAEGGTLLTCAQKNEYIDLLDNFTNRQIIQLARLSQKTGKMSFEQLVLLFKYGEMDNPWERLDYNKVKNIKEILSEKVVGQEQAIAKVEKMIVKAYMGLTGIHKPSSSSAPKGVLFFVGPTGVGKTELAKALAKFLFGDEDACIRFDMSEYMDETSDQKFIGASPGYVGYEEGGVLTNAVKKKPFSILLFDEIEKATTQNPRILDMFLQILEDGRLTDNKGEIINFDQTIIIFTSNLGAADVSPTCSKKECAKQFVQIVKNYFNKEIRRPELLGRIGINNIVPFNFIKSRTFAVEIAKSKLRPIKNAIMQKYKIQLDFENELQFVDYVLGEDNNIKGGRDILNALNDILLDELAMFMFKCKENLKTLEGAKLLVKVVNNKLEFSFHKKDK